VSAPAHRPHAWIVSARYDLPLLVLAPTLALLLGGLAWFTGEQEAVHGLPWLTGASDAVTGVLLVALIQGHLVLVLVRSHLNPKVFAAHRWRFVAAPLVLLGLQLWSPWICIGVSVGAIYWDVYHSSLQTFGLGRIYDARAGHDPAVGRGLDKLFNLVIYITPILAGANLIEHFDAFREFEQLDATWLAGMPDHVASLRLPLAVIGIGFSVGGLTAYLLGLRRLQRGGYRLPLPKALLLGNTGLVAVLAWGVLEPLYAFFVMNVFHAVQYYALVWATERKNLVARLRLAGRAASRPLALALLLGVSLGYGWLLPHLNESLGSDPMRLDGGLLALATLNTVSILHFWYDGFVWSVRQRQV
jgi:hypothetical protein